MYVAHAMAASLRRARVFLLLIGSVLALAAWPSVASADVSLSDGKFGGGTTGNSSPPGGVLPASVKGTVSGATWSSTRWTIGSSTGCYNHGNCTSGDHTIDFRTNNKNTVTAPGGPDDSYAVVYTPYASNDCSGNPSGSAYTLTNALNVTGPGKNPDLVERCGINVMLVLDESGSIASSNATGAVRTATKSFLVALSGTGSEVSIVDFSSTADRPIGIHGGDGRVDRRDLQPVHRQHEPRRSATTRAAGRTGRPHSRRWTRRTGARRPTSSSS